MSIVIYQDLLELCR